MHVHLYVDVIYLEVFEMTLNLHCRDGKPRMHDFPSDIPIGMCILSVHTINIP